MNHIHLSISCSRSLSITGNLRNMAIDMGSELENQNRMIDRINTKVMEFLNLNSSNACSSIDHSIICAPELLPRDVNGNGDGDVDDFENLLIYLINSYFPLFINRANQTKQG